MGSAVEGCNDEHLFFDVATGHLMVRQRDELLVEVALDAAVTRTDNGVGNLSVDNSDNWRTD